ncbi:MAG: hypothetical protein V4457_05410 [Pseudomonadota bacterium]
MKLKSLSLLGLLAAAPMASQAAMVEMNETELSDTNGQGFTYNYNFSVTNTSTVAGYGVDTTVYGTGTDASHWNLGGSQTVTGPVRWATISKEIGVECGTKYIDTHKSWGRNNT